MIASQGAATYLDRARGALGELEARALRRTVRAQIDPKLIDFSSNDYLGLSRHPKVVEAFSNAERAGSGGARLLGGARPELIALEAAIATYTGRERALVFSSGYLAALGGIGTLAPLFARAVSDERNHACLIDALRLTKIPRTIAAHGTLAREGAQPGGTLFVTESLFGMDGSACDIGALVAKLGPDDVAFVDEAHALGIAGGTRGAGLCSTSCDPRLIVLGTLSKAFGCAGGFIAGPAEIIDLATSTARGFVFDTAMPPALATAASVAIAIAESDEGDALRKRLRDNVDAFRARLGAKISLRPAHPAAPIVPVIVGGARMALGIASDLEREGFFAPAIRPPTVPGGSSRLRVTLRADHEREDVERLAEAIARALDA